MRSRLPFKSQGLNGRQALLGALKQVLLRERKAQEEGKRKVLPLACLEGHARPLVPPKRSYAGHRGRITVILIHHLSLRVSSTL